MKSGAVVLAAFMLTMTHQPELDALLPVHTHNEFQFVVSSPLRRAAPLFGPAGERCWAGPHWNPEFLYPLPGVDTQGAVFTVQHGPHTSVWANTVFDLDAGRMQYVSFIPQRLVSIIDVQLTALGPSSTRVSVTYERTALNAAANEDVQGMGQSDRASGPQWQQAIERCLAGQR